MLELAVLERGLATYDATTFRGQEEFLPAVGEIYASPVATESAIFFATRDGHVLVLRPGAELEILADNQFDEGFDASPAIVDNEMYLRGRHFLYRIEAR